MDTEKLYEALQELKQYCEEHFDAHDNCDCPCDINGECAILENRPNKYTLKKRTVFF